MNVPDPQTASKPGHVRLAFGATQPDAIGTLSGAKRLSMLASLARLIALPKVPVGFVVACDGQSSWNPEGPVTPLSATCRCRQAVHSMDQPIYEIGAITCFFLDVPIPYHRGAVALIEQVGFVVIEVPDPVASSALRSYGTGGNKPLVAHLSALFSGHQLCVG